MMNEIVKEDEKESNRRQQGPYSAKTPALEGIIRQSKHHQVTLHATNTEV
jgi:hypothetical protein